MRLADPEIQELNRQPADKEQHAAAQRSASNDQSSGSRGRPETGPEVLTSADRVTFLNAVQLGKVRPP